MRKFIFLLNLLMFAGIQRNLRRFLIKSHHFASFLNVRMFKKTKTFEISIFSIVYNNENDVDAIQHILILFNFFDFDLSASAFAAFMSFVIVTQSFFSLFLMRIFYEKILNIISNYNFNQNSHANRFVDDKTHIYVIFKKITKMKIDFENDTIHFHHFCECK